MRGLALRLVVPVAFVLACSDDGVPADGGNDTTTEGGDDDDDDGTVTAPTMSGGETMSATMTDPSGPSDTSSADGPEGTGSTTSPTDGTTESTGPGSSDGSSSDGSTTDGSSSDSSSDDDSSSDGASTDTGPDPEDECVVDDDCILINDCCTCDAIPATDPAPDCDIVACLIPTCQSQGIPSAEAVCEFGSCELASVACDPDLVFCDSDPPDCGPGFFPGVDPESSCWTGMCVPVDVCETVPSCDDCAADESCVEYVMMGGSNYHCSAIPDACDGAPSCACMGEACEEPYDTCADGPTGLTCSCLFCG